MCYQFDIVIYKVVGMTFNCDLRKTGARDSINHVVYEMGTLIAPANLSSLLPKCDSKINYQT